MFSQGDRRGSAPPLGRVLGPSLGLTIGVINSSRSPK
jgi:hypothetical protein